MDIDLVHSIDDGRKTLRDECGDYRVTEEGYLCTNINPVYYQPFFTPTTHIHLAGTSWLMVEMPDGISRKYVLSRRGHLMAIADRDEAWRTPSEYRTMMALEPSEMARINSMVKGTPRLRFIADSKIENSTKCYIRWQYQIQKKIVWKVNFPPTNFGINQAKKYDYYFNNKCKYFIKYYDIVYKNTLIKKWKEEGKDKYIYFDTYSQTYELLMKLSPIMRDHFKRTFEGTDEGKKLAEVYRDHVLQYCEHPDWTGSSIEKIDFKIKDLYIKKNAKRWNVEIKGVISKTFKTKKEAISARNRAVLLNDFSLFYDKFEPVPESQFDMPMYPIAAPKYKTKNYISTEKQQLVHDELITWIKERNRINEGRLIDDHLFKCVEKQPLPPNLIEAIVLISSKLKNYSKYRKYFGVAWERMQQKVLDEIDRTLHYYKPNKATPFTFLTILVRNNFDKVAAELRNEYKKGNGLPQYATFNDDYMGAKTLESARSGTDNYTINHEVDDTDIDTNNIADIIRDDIAKYMQLAESLNMTFAEYLMLCKKHNKIIQSKSEC